MILLGRIYSKIEYNLVWQDSKMKRNEHLKIKTGCLEPHLSIAAKEHENCPALVTGRSWKSVVLNIFLSEIFKTKLRHCSTATIISKNGSLCTSNLFFNSCGFPILWRMSLTVCNSLLCVGYNVTVASNFYDIPAFCLIILSWNIFISR